MKKQDFFTAGTTKEAVSKDLKIKAKCDGQGGAPAGTDEAGFMIVEFDSIRVTQV